MARSNADRETWQPQTRQECDAVLHELQEILASPHFCNSKRYPALLRYVVENTLAGGSGLLKERTLGVEVFDRPSSYDTNADTVVRYTAGEVRKRLSLYYHELDRKPEIQISLPPGSYVPEFLHSRLTPTDATDHASYPEFHPLHADNPSALERVDHEPGALSRWGLDDPDPLPTSEITSHAGPAVADGIARSSLRRRLALAAVLLIAVFVGMGWRYKTTHVRTAIDIFWAPLIGDQHTVLVCSGGTTIVPNTLPGFTTANKNTDYPYVSLQIASSVAQLSALLERNGATTELRAAAFTPLTDLRERPVIMLGGYNNQWTLRSLQPLRFHFSPEADAAIVDETQPQTRWVRDHSLPYSSADDYALVARFRDVATDNWVIALAGVGRNGTEAATQFATTPRYMQLLRDQIGGADFANRNVEVVLKVNVIEGKTGAPSIQQVYVW
jgi:hypothetical protein